MKIMIGIAALLVAVVGFVAVRAMPETPRELEYGQTGLTRTSDPESGETLIYADKFRMGFDVIPVGTRVKYLGAAPKQPDMNAPMIRVSIEEGEQQGLICSISKADFRAAP